MRRVVTSLLLTAMTATPAFAAAEGSGNGLLITAFFGFAALIIAFQFVPAVVLFGAMLKALFSPKKEAPAEVPKK